MSINNVFKFYFNILVEHLLAILNGIYLTSNCYGYESEIEAYFRQAFSGFFSLFSYNLMLGILAQSMNTFCTFAWTFIDCYLIVISILLTDKFRLINEKLYSNQIVNFTPIFCIFYRI